MGVGRVPAYIYKHISGRLVPVKLFPMHTERGNYLLQLPKYDTGIPNAC